MVKVVPLLLVVAVFTSISSVLLLSFNDDIFFFFFVFELTDEESLVMAALAVDELRRRPPNTGDARGEEDEPLRSKRRSPNAELLLALDSIFSFVSIDSRSRQQHVYLLHSTREYKRGGQRASDYVGSEQSKAERQ